jgi:hypothetical protein
MLAATGDKYALITSGDNKSKTYLAQSNGEELMHTNDRGGTIVNLLCLSPQNFPDLYSLAFSVLVRIVRGQIEYVP